jgi:AraC family transcriptional regulator
VSETTIVSGKAFRKEAGDAGMANVQMQQSTYIAPGFTTRGAVEKESVNKCNAPKLHLAQASVSDLSLIYPEAVVASSQELGWQNARAVHMRHELTEWDMPPFENHCIIVQLGPSLNVSARIDGHVFDQRLQPGDITIVPAGLASHWRRQDAGVNDTLHIYLNPHFVRATAESCDLNHGQISIEPQFGVKDEHIHHIGMSLLCELKEANVVGRLYADSMATVLAMQLVRRYSYLKDVHHSRGGIAPRKLRKAIEFINDNLDQEQTVALGAVAEEVGVSYFHFSRAFKQSMGVSLNLYMIEQRIERAKKLLSETELPIAEIALRVGFANQSHFTTTFRKLAWTTPKAFREML